jgi:hypothetical protein
MRWFNSAAACLAAEWRFKAALSLGLSVMFCVPYFTLQYLTLWPVRTFALTPVDEAIVFDPAWVWAYQSVYLLVGLVPWVSTSRAQLARTRKDSCCCPRWGFSAFWSFRLPDPGRRSCPRRGCSAGWCGTTCHGMRSRPCTSGWRATA